VVGSPDERQVTRSGGRSLVEGAVRPRFRRGKALLADDLHFEGPIDTFDRADDYLAAIRNLMGMARGMEHQGMIAEGADVATFYRLDTPVAIAPVAEWYTVRNGKIVTLRAYFDARPFAPPGAVRPTDPT
jgi:hypothetical protein